MVRVIIWSNKVAKAVPLSVTSRNWWLHKSIWICKSPLGQPNQNLENVHISSSFSHNCSWLEYLTLPILYVFNLLKEWPSLFLEWKSIPLLPWKLSSEDFAIIPEMWLSIYPNLNFRKILERTAIQYHSSLTTRYCSLGKSPHSRPEEMI